MPVLELVPAQLSGVEARFEVREGVPCQEISKAAADTDSDLVVIGTRGLLGSVAQNVTRDAPCPVLAVPCREGT